MTTMPGDGPGWPVPGLYIVERRDTLISISKKVDVPWRVLAAYNGLTEPYNILEGMELQLPYQEFTVSAGDYLHRIAKEHAHGLPWQVLAYYNHLEAAPHVLQIGDIIRIPVVTIPEDKPEVQTGTV